MTNNDWIKAWPLLLILTFVLIVALLSACESTSSVCPPTNGTPQPTLDLAALIAMTPTPGPSPTPVEIEIGGKMIRVDRIVSGPLCNDTWSGTIYVDCDVQVPPWDQDEEPLFFEACDLEIEPGTTVYVADHNDAAYYKGCSCHTGRDPVE
jgi:hypothetical protein